jgi:alpha-L-rhamnosidase
VCDAGNDEAQYTAQAIKTITISYMKIVRIITGLLFIALFNSAQAQVQVNNLRCEMLHNPLGIDVPQPRLSWSLVSSVNNVQQVAYQILVASSAEKLKANMGDVWNSGKVNSSQSAQVVYQGKPLQSRTQLYWKVKSFTGKGETGWSNTATWSMGLLQPGDWRGKWIGMDSAFAWDSVTKFSRLSARYLRKVFAGSKKIKQATAYIAGMGMYELYINGKKMGDHVLAPAPTDYRKSVLYNTLDVTSALQQGNNAIGVVLGNGRFFTMRQNYKPKKIATFGYPKLLFQLEVTYTDGSTNTMVSDQSWKLTADGPIRSNNEYDGEEYNANKELTGWNTTAYNDAKWLVPQLVEAPGGKLTAQMNEPMRVMQHIVPVSIQPKDNGYVVDMGQNMAGWLQLKIRGKKGDTITIRFAESLQPDGHLYTANLRDAQSTDRYIVKGTGEEQWHPVFVFHGFRYAYITGYRNAPQKADIDGQVVYDALGNTGTFASSNEVLNGIHRNAWWGIASNYKGMPIDCPQRNERQPWLGDRTIGALGESFLFGNGNLYAKWLNDIQQAQTDAGVIPDVAPAYWNYYTDDVTWPAAYFTIAHMLYQQYGDNRSIVAHYPSMKKWIEHMRDSYLKNNLMTRDKYGDWCVPPESLELIHAKDSSRNTDGVLIATAYYYQLLQYMKQFAVLAGQPADTTAYNRLAVNIRQAFNEHFYNRQKKYYSNNTVTANLLPLYFGLVPDTLQSAVFDNIVKKVWVDDHGHISTGLIGTQYLMRGLTKFGRPELAYQLAATKTYPGWGYMLQNGATTIWELWNGNTANPQMNSQNHVMLLGDLLTWLYEDLAGIKAAAPGFSKLIMQPHPVDGLDQVKATHNTLYGTITSEWKNTPQQFDWHVTLPPNTTAEVYVPATTATVVVEGATGATLPDGVQLLRRENAFAVYAISSGHYHFIVNRQFKKGIVKAGFIFNEAPFPESHSATLAETPKGLVAAWFGGTKERNPDVEIYVSRMVSNQWTTPVSVANGIINDTQRLACWNPVLYQVPGGELWLFYKVGPNVAGWKGWMKKSKDNGITWGNAIALPDGFIGPVKNKPVLVNNTLICPSSTEGNGWKVHFEITTDWGKTWQKIGPVNDGKPYNTIQPSVLQYADGHLEVLCRTKERVVARSASYDGGKTWSAFTATALPNNNSGTDAVTLKDGRQLIVYNHVKPAPSLKNGKGARTPLNVAVSKDGQLWQAALILEDSPVSQYSYPSVIQTADGRVHVVYTWRREKIKYVQIDPTQLDLKPILNEQWPGAVLQSSSQAADDL